MLKRRKILLGTILSAKSPPRYCDLMTWLHDLSSKVPTAGGPPYEFVQDGGTPWSFTAEHDIHKLSALGLVFADKLAVRPESRAEALEQFRTLESGLRSMIAALGANGPCQSYVPEISQASPRKPAQKKRRAGQDHSQVIYTCGYERMTVEAFVGKLMGLGMQLVVDVRKNPVSRKFGFSKGSLARVLASLRIEYVHLPALGIPTARRRDLRTAEDYDSLFDHYERSILPREMATVDRAAGLAREKASCLVCYEGDAIRCHRSRVANAMSAKTGLPVVNL